MFRVLVIQKGVALHDPLCDESRIVRKKVYLPNTPAIMVQQSSIHIIGL